MSARVWRKAVPLLLLAGCVVPPHARGPTLAVLDEQLDAARRAGLPTELIYVGRALPWRGALAAAPATRPETTYLVVTRTDAGIRLGVPAPLSAAEADEVLRRWPQPFLFADDVDGAAKALVWGYLERLRVAGRVRPSGQVVPFLEPVGPRLVPQGTWHWGLPLALAVAAAVAWAAGRGQST